MSGGSREPPRGEGDALGEVGPAHPIAEDIQATRVVASEADEAASAPALEPTSRELIPGLHIRQYELIRELGRGGMGQVFLARDTKLGRRVAMKFLSAISTEFTERFLVEARATAQCSHENIVVIHEVDQHRGRPYMVLEYLEGATLRNETQDKRLPASRAVELMVPVLRALARAHEFGIVHRDLKPENIFVTSTGTVKVLDFGIAKLFSQRDRVAPSAAEPGHLAVTQQGSLMGTLAYMAPEQFWHDVDPRADLWAVGIILFELVAGRHPLTPLTTQSVLASASDLERPLPRIADQVPDLPRKLEQVIDRCLRKHKAERCASAREVIEELEPLLPRRFGRQLGEDESPFPGLTAFQESDADRFFGRAQDISRMVAQLRNQPIVGLVGPSGVGKSSFVRAGVIPALKASGEWWEVFMLRPGRSPLMSLASALQPLTSGSSGGWQNRISEHQALTERLRAEPGFLGALLRGRAGPDTRILLFIDQFEELYTLAPEPAERMAFTACLAGVADDAAAPVRLLVSMRSDLLDRVAEDRRFMAELTRGLVFLPALGREGLREALTQPVEMLGYSFETSAMVVEMLDALATTAGALPLLQFAAARLWESRDRRRKMLTQDSYAGMGGISGALATHADEVVARLSPSARRLARTVFQRLVTPEGTRAIVESSELRELPADPADLQTLVNDLVAARLLVVQTRSEAEGSAVELVHESLIGGWPTLQRWLDEGREDAAFLAQLRAAAKQWDLKGRPKGLLWRDEAMAEARLWRARYQGGLAAREQEFLDQVFAVAGRAARVKRALVAGTIGFLLLVVAVSGVALMLVRGAERTAVREKLHAQTEAERARAAEQKVKDQLSVIQAEQQAKQAAEQAVERGKVDLRAALKTAQEESRKAHDAAAKSQQLADSLRKANSELRARAERLEKERRKISKDLK
ncbi:MAG TPA: protein kinase [Polyangia bacterium]|nr:protein kinase [Polyangia bacterium]